MHGNVCLFVLTAEFNLPDELKSAIDEAKRRYEEATSKLDVDYFVFDKFGKDYLKQNRLSPDSFMQLAIQVCYLKVIVIMPGYCH